MKLLLKNVIITFKALLPIYQKAVDEKYIYHKMTDNGIDSGLCYASLRNKTKCELYCLFDEKGYYKNYIDKDNNIIYPLPTILKRLKKNNKEVLKAIEFRLNFIKTEIKELTSLAEKGYTHI